MNGTFKIVLGTVVWCLLAAYLVFAANLCSRAKENIEISDLSIRVLGKDGQTLMTPETVGQWIKEGGHDMSGIQLSDVNTNEIKSLLEAKPFVANARVYTDMTGGVNVDITQRRPIVRFKTQEGYDFYISEDKWVLPYRTGGAVYVPVISGRFALPFGREFEGSLDELASDPQKKSSQSYLYLLKLINFVRLTGNSSFWDAQIVQVNVTGKGASAFSGPDGAGNDARWLEPEIELIPRVGRHVVVFGTLDDAEIKLEKLMAFYKKVLDYEGWDSYRVIDLKYRDQVVCRK